MHLSSYFQHDVELGVAVFEGLIRGGVLLMLMQLKLQGSSLTGAPSEFPTKSVICDFVPFRSDGKGHFPPPWPLWYLQVANCGFEYVLPLAPGSPLATSPSVACPTGHLWWEAELGWPASGQPFSKALLVAPCADLSIITEKAPVKEVARTHLS